MDAITKDKIETLAKISGQNLISMYIPTHRVGRKTQQDPIRMKNMLSRVVEQLEKSDLRRSEINELLKPVESLSSESDFWRHQSDGLAIYITDNFMEYFRLPIEFDELFVIANRFHLKPILPLLSRNGHFYMLALSQKQIRLLEGTLFSVDEIELDDVPNSLQEALFYDDPEKQLQYHTSTGTPGNIGARSSVYHGQGASEDDSKNNILRFFHKVDTGLMELLRSEQSPLVLAGVNYLIPIYREANQYPHLVETTIEGNPDELSAEKLHDLAWKIVQPIFSSDLHQAKSRYKEFRGSNNELVSSSLEDIIPAAHYGRVDTLFVSLEQQVWGRFDATNNKLERTQGYQINDLDLLDLAAVQTFLNGGVVYALEDDDMPDAVQLAAIYRYPMDA